jgi:hypothetical protein
MATLLRGFIATRRGQLDRAEATFRSSLARNGETQLALRGLALALRGQSRWEDLSATATSWIAFHDDDRSRSLKALEHRARAWLELGRWDEVTSDIAALNELGSKPAKRIAEAFDAWMLCRTAQWSAALATANRVFKLGGLDAEMREELRAVRCDAAHRLGRRRSAWELQPADLAKLRARGHGAWVDRLRSECGLVEG